MTTLLAWCMYRLCDFAICEGKEDIFFDSALTWGLMTGVSRAWK